MREADHLGVWVIKVPADMPIIQITMLQATIRSAWQGYTVDGGDPGDTEAFWSYLSTGWK